MKKETLSLEMTYFDSELELTKGDSELLDHARAAAKRAYAPYSKFRVGAAALLANGVVVEGNNQENAAYPSGLCAERVALFYANAQYPDQAVVAIAITVLSERTVIEEPITPCGSCRQVMAEVENKSGVPLRMIMQGEKGRVMIINNVRTLLPFSFLNETLLKYTSE